MFELYTLNDNLDVFRFGIGNKSILEYWIDLKSDGLELIFEALPKEKKLLENHDTLFLIRPLYNTQKDVAEELVIKAKAYPEEYKKILNKQFHVLFKDPSIIDRLLIGNYSKPSDINKRSMAKFTQDIARQLKLIT